MTSIDLTITLHSDIVPPPPGWKLFRVTKWPVVEMGLSFEIFGGSSFEVIPLWVPETRQWSAVKGNFSILDEDGVARLKALQPNDGVPLSKKVGWLVHTGIGVSPMWTHSDADWNTATTYEVGTMLWGDQLFAASEEVFYITTSLGYGAYRKVLPFRRADWQKDPQQYPYLFPQATVCKPDGGILYEWDGRGVIRTMLQVLDPADYKFAGSLKPSAFYVLDSWCLPL